MLALIQNGMRTDAYTNNDVIKASYVGAREAPRDREDHRDGTGDTVEAGAEERRNGRRFKFETVISGCTADSIIHNCDYN